jgi:hypothetical protein
MRFEFKPSFDRSVKSLSPSVKQEIKELCLHLVDVLSVKIAHVFKVPFEEVFYLDKNNLKD